jgi:outer membrane protein assembly factor BamB
MAHRTASIRLARGTAPFHAACWALPIVLGLVAARPVAAAESIWPDVPIQRGICAVLGLPQDAAPEAVVQLAEQTELLIYCQAPQADQVAALREAAQSAGYLGTRIFVDRGPWRRIHLADNLADAVLVCGAAVQAVPREELLRILHPGGQAVLPDQQFVKPVPGGVDDWSHPYHGPDNNPSSTDQLARAPYLTQFLADPKFCPMPEISVAAGGRVFRAFGHIAHKANQNPMLNKLICANVYNGTVLWQRELPAGFMIHRNTLVATPEILYLADHRSCQRIDAASGEVLDTIVVPEGIADGQVWKWMALVDGVLYALVGHQEVSVNTQRSQTPGLGHWPWGMWEGHDYADPVKAFGFGRTFVAFDPASKEVLWSRRLDRYADSRGVCLRDGRIYFYCPEHVLGCLNAADGSIAWQNTDAELLEAIGPNQRAQHYVTGYATTAYIKAAAEQLLFAGPQRSRLVAASTRDGRLLWQKEHGNFQLVLRPDAIYAAGPQVAGAPGVPDTGYKLDYATGDVLGQLPMRRACTRATGTLDSIFFRASGGTVRIDVASGHANHIAPMRPPCQDGVIISDGNLLWGPWMCGCQLSLYGHIGLTSAGPFDFRPGLDPTRLESFPGADSVTPLDVETGDWPTWQGDAAQTAETPLDLPERLESAWRYQIPDDAFPTAPVTAGGLVFFGDRRGTIRALDAATGQLRWSAHTAGAVFVAPAIEDGRLFAGSADGRVYALEAATGRQLWTFRAAPAERWIPVYQQLMSTWPVAGGVVVREGVVYAAAGIAHYDGTHVYALDAATGAVRWYNDGSGTTSEVANHGVSLQGELTIRDGELRFVGGGVHELARYDLETGHCLNESSDLPRSAFHTAFYAYYPEYGRYTFLDCPRSNGTSLCYDCTYEGSWHGNLALLPALPAGVTAPPKPVSRWGVQGRRQPRQPAPLWQHPAGRRFNAFVVAPNLLLAAGHTEVDGSDTSFLATVNLQDGNAIAVQRLTGPVVKGGLAVDRARRVFVSLENGSVLGFGPVP